MWTMRNDFHPRATAFTSRGSRGIQPFSIHSTSTPEDRLRGGEKGKSWAQTRYESKSPNHSIYYSYDEKYRLMIAWITRVFPITIVGRVLHALFICFLHSVCEKVFCFLFLFKLWLSFFVKIYSLRGNIILKFNIKI